MTSILIIDDENLIRRSLSRALPKYIKSSEIFEASDGLQGQEMWLRIKPDLVIIDVLMPEMSGPEVIRSIPVGMQTKVVMISAHQGQIETQTPGLKYDLFIAKPFEDIHAVAEQISKVLV
ncbi:MAG: response regulator [Bdellovibrionota bacterium]